MATGTKIRALTRLLDASPTPVWVIGPTGKLVYLSAGVADWLGIDPATLLDRRSIAGAPISDDPLDFIAASLSPPPGFAQRGTASLRIQPPPFDGKKISSIDVRFTQVGAAADALTIAIAGDFDDATIDIEIQDAVALRQRLDAWRRRHKSLATIATAGISPAARRLRGRLQVAASTRTHIGFFGPQGSGALSIASRIHQLSAPGEAMAQLDGPLMDAELLDATLMPVVNQLADSNSGMATVLVADLDDTPWEAQQRLAELLSTFTGRLRLLALCTQRPKLLVEPLTEDVADDPEFSIEEETSVGLHPKLMDLLSSFTVVIEPFSQRVDDIPVLATASLDARHAAGDGPAERFSRAALDALVNYPWPGNFAELDGAIRHAIKSAPHESIGVEHLPLAVRSFRPGENPAPEKHTNVSLDDAVARYEMKIIHETVAATKGNRAEAARRLGISRARLLRKLDG